MFFFVDSVKVSGSNIYVLLYKQEFTQTPSIGYSYGKVSLLKSSDGGDSFAEIFTSDDPAGHNDVKEYGHRNIAISGNNIYLTWTEYGQAEGIKIFGLTSVDGGKTFTKTFVDEIPDLPFGPDFIYFDETDFPFSIDADGQNVNLVYERPIKSGDDIHSFLVKSTDYGKTYEKRVKLGNSDERHSEFSPRMVSSSDEVIHVTWISGKMGLPLPTDADTFYSRIDMKASDLNEGLSLSTNISDQVDHANLDQELLKTQKNSDLLPEQLTTPETKTNAKQCKEYLALVTKHDGTPACVKPESIPKLIQRGWAAEDVIFEQKNFVASNNKTIKNEWTASYYLNFLPLQNGEFEKNFEKVILWNMLDQLENHGIENWRNDSDTGPHTDEGWLNPSKMCSKIFLEDGTEHFVSAEFYSQPELNITKIIIDDLSPADCQKWFPIPYEIRFEDGVMVYEYEKIAKTAINN